MFYGFRILEVLLFGVSILNRDLKHIRIMGAIIELLSNMLNRNLTVSFP
ncbi:hypothetical protein SAMN05660909_00234 [Chitinophaga terrae (ex Kim and Jung 2007)]|uniref:Uncharacterized protein n=1 Tax=Chitinophaga terrae (ex Kim and Jung 2007) TaxID=408074 RepID=A0A1H3X4S7_9BACT|nr:hypothetical protein SAMN05660909_00234 [Chitinophaga terrae (ex Kim and Jung 2007)]